MSSSGGHRGTSHRTGVALLGRTLRERGVPRRTPRGSGGHLKGNGANEVTMELMERKNQAATVKTEGMEGPREGGRQGRAAGSRGRGAGARGSRGEAADRGGAPPRGVRDQQGRKWEVKNGAEGAGD